MSTPISATPTSETYAPRDGDPQPTPPSPRRRLAGRVATVAAAVAVAAGAVGLGVWEANRDVAPGVTRIQETTPAPPPPADPVALTSRLNPQFITDATVTQSYSGLTLTGSIPAAAVATEESTRATAAYLNTLTRDSCADNVSLSTPDNLRVKMWGFCFSALPDEDFADLLVYALDSEASQIDVAEHPSADFERNANLTWLPSTSVTYDRALAGWEELEKPESLLYIELAAYGAGRMSDHMDYANLTAEGLAWGWNSTDPRHPVS